jgi:Fe/S biogenesis protein NfuA
MIVIAVEAQAHFRRLIEQQGDPGTGIRVGVVKPGTPQADCTLELCEPAELQGDEWILECEGFSLYVAAAASDWLQDAEIGFNRSPTGGQLTIRAPRLKGARPEAGASMIERVRYVVDHEVNPQLASHKGHVQLESVEADGTVVLRFGGGCHGCGMVDVTLRDGIERTVRERVPEITGVRDATDHGTGTAPYVPRGEPAHS